MLRKPLRFSPVTAFVALWPLLPTLTPRLTVCSASCQEVFDLDVDGHFALDFFG
jgi:hypothetical protein